jgi:hypothetical protein
MAPARDEQARHQENIERLVRLEARLERVIDDISEVKGEVKPISKAFEQAKGIKAAVLFISVLVVGGIGAGFREIMSWILTALGKH